MYIEEATRILGISYTTLKRWALQGKVRRYKSEKGKWIFFDSEIYALVGKRVESENWVAVYCRVAGTTESSRALMADQQETIRAWCMARGLRVDRLYEDWAKGTDFSLEERPGLHLLLQDIIQRRVAAVVVESPDRIARVGRELVEELARYYGVQIAYLNQGISRPEYIKEQEGDLVHLLKAAKIERLGELAGDPLPKPVKRKITRPGKITPYWEGAPLPKGSQIIDEDPDLSNLI